MSTNSKVYMGLIMFWLIATMICNWYQGASMYNEMSTNVSELTGYETTTQTDALGTAARAPSISDSIIDVLGKIFLFDYVLFKNIDNPPDANGNYPDNGFVFFRYLLIAIGAVLWLQLAIILFNIIASFF